MPSPLAATTSGYAPDSGVPMTRSAIAMSPESSPNAGGSTALATLPFQGVAMGGIAAYLQRFLIEHYKIPAGDPMHALVEHIRAIEQSGIFVIRSMEGVMDRENKMALSWDEARKELGKVVQDQRDELRPGVEKLVGLLTSLEVAVKRAEEHSTGVADQVKALPDLLTLLRNDVEARARERWGQGIQIILTALVFSLVSGGLVAWFFMHFLRVQ